MRARRASRRSTMQPRPHGTRGGERCRFGAQSLRVGCRLSRWHSLSVRHAQWFVEVEGSRYTVSSLRPLRAASERSIEVPRTARYYVLGDDVGDIEEVWFVLHGFGQLARDFVHYFGVLADGKRLVIAPEALNRYYAVGTSVPAKDRPVGATWMTREDRDNEIRDYVRYLDLLHEAVVADHPRARTVVVGFSQGGATASRWAIHGTARIDRLILW